MSNIIIFAGFILAIYWLFQLIKSKKKNTALGKKQKRAGYAALAVILVGMTMDNFTQSSESKKPETVEKADVVSEKDDKKALQKKQLDDLNKWYKNDYVEHFDGEIEKWHNALAQFNVSGDYLLASVYMTEMEKDKIEKNDIGTYAFVNVLPQYTGDLSAFSNIEKNTLQPEKLPKSERYVEYYVK